MYPGRGAAPSGGCIPASDPAKVVLGGAQGVGLVDRCQELRAEAALAPTTVAVICTTRLRGRVGVGAGAGFVGRAVMAG